MHPDRFLLTRTRVEDSRRQFKRDAANADGLAAEMAALANSGDGQLFVGLMDDGRIFMVKAVVFVGKRLADTHYLDREDIDGTLPEQYQCSFAFIRRNFHHVRNGRCFNTSGELEIPETVLEELLVNALIHRDCFTSASIRIMVFADRIEIIRPGHLSDTLAAQAIRQGCSSRRQPTLTEQASHPLPHRSMPRVLGEWSQIDLIDGPVGNHSAVAWRPETVTGQITESIRRLLTVMVAEYTRSELRHLLIVSLRDNFIVGNLQLALDAGWIEMTIPQKPISRLQKYRLTPAGKDLLENKDTWR